MARHKKHHGKKHDIEERLQVSYVGDRIMVAWFERDGSHEAVVLPEKAIPYLVRRLASWMELD